MPGVPAFIVFVMVAMAASSQAAPVNRQPDAGTNVTCSVVTIGRSARISCSGPSGLVSVGPVRPGVEVSASGSVRLGDVPRCSRDSTAPALVRLCSSAAVLVLTDSVVHEVDLRSDPKTVAVLSVEVSGDVVVSNMSAMGVQGASAVQLVAAGDVRVSSSLFVNNSAGFDDAGTLLSGGGLAVSAGAATRLVTFDGCTFLNNTAAAGGGSYVDMRRVGAGAQLQLVNNNTFARCNASNKGAGLLVNATGTVGVKIEIMGTAVFHGNNGQALYVDMSLTQAGNVTISGRNVFSTNSANNNSGAAVRLRWDDSSRGFVLITGNTRFQDNNADSGGAVHMRFSNSNNSAMVISGSTIFRGNTAKVGGAAVLNCMNSTSCIATISGNTTFQGNTAVNFTGGAVYMDFSSSMYSTVLISGSTSFQRNTAQGVGAAFFDCTSSTSCNATISGNTSFQDNNAANYSCGAVYMDFSSSKNSAMVISGNTSFQRNTAQNGNAGATFLECANSTSCNATISGNTSFQDNIAIGSGAVYMDFSSSKNSAMLISGSTSFQRNTAQNGNAGAALLDCTNSTSCTATISGNTRFQDNNADSGGAVYMSFSTSNNSAVLISGDTMFRGNSAMGGLGGAAILNCVNSTSCNATILGNTSFQHNTAVNSGAGAVAMAFSNSTNNTMLISGNTSFQDNTAINGTTGAVYVIFSNSANNSLIISGNTSFQRNSATRGLGGATYLDFSNSTFCTIGIVDNTSFQNNTVTASASASDVSIGGAVVLRVSSGSNNAVIFQAVVTGNTAGYAGGVSAFVDDAENTTLIFKRAHFQGNTAAVSGGGLLVYGNSSRNTAVSVLDSIFEVNQANQGSGGGMAAVAGPPSASVSGERESRNTVRYIVSNTSFTNNHVTSGTGGGLHVEGTSRGLLKCERIVGNDTDNCLATFGLEEVEFSNNSATLGGGLYAINTQATIRFSRFHHNSASQAGGGGYTKGVTRLKLEWTDFSQNRATVEGGGMATNLGDDFLANAMLCTSCSFTNNTATRGGGVHQSGGSNEYRSSQFSGNVARQQGGAVVFENICGAGDTVQSCNLNMTNGTTAHGNTGLVGGGVFIATPDTLGYSLTQLQQVTNSAGSKGRGRNIARYSSDVAVAPGAESLQLLSKHTLPVASSIDPFTGGINLTAEIDQPAIRLQVELCDVNQQLSTYLTGVENSTVAILSPNQSYAARFDSLRLMGGRDKATYCLRLFAPDYPLVKVREFTVSIRGCKAGESNNAVAGCTRCPGSQYSFNVGDCKPCPATAKCLGGLDFVPNEGLWHSTWNTSRTYTCPNPAACQGNRTELRQCQNNMGENCPGQVKAYSDWQCSPGYQGRLCANCGTEHGSSTAFRCHRCASQGLSIMFVVLAGISVCLVIVFIGTRSVDQQLQVVNQQGVLATERFGGIDQHNKANSHGSATDGVCHNGVSVCLPMPHMDGKQLPDVQSQRHGSDHKQGPSSDAMAADQTSGVGLAAVAGQLREVASRSSSLLTTLVDGVEAPDVFKVFVLYMQYLGILRNLVIDWPPRMRQLMNVGKLLGDSQSSEWFSLDCVGDHSKATLLWLKVLLNLCLIVLASTVACGVTRWGSKLCQLLLSRLCGNSSSKASHPAAEKPPISDVAVATAVVGVFMLYASMVTTFLSTFACLEVDGTSYWSVDTEVQCWGSDHASSLTLGVIGLVVVAMGVPAAVFLLLRRSSSVAHTASTQRRFGFLFKTYHQSCQYWEACVCLQTVALVSVDQFARQSGPLYQLVSVMLVLVVSYAIWIAVRPFRSRALMTLHLVGMLCLQLTCLMMMLLLRGFKLGADDVDVTGGWVRDTVGVVMVVMNSMFVVTCCVAMAHVFLTQQLAADGWLRVTVAKLIRSSRIWLDSFRGSRP